MPIEPREQLKLYFGNGAQPVQENFWNWIDSFIHKTEDGITSWTAPDGSKLIGIGIQQPAGPLSIKAIGPNERLMAFHHADGRPMFYFNLLPAGDRPGFNILRSTAAGNVSNFFIDETNGWIGLGSLAPSRQLHLRENRPADMTALRVENIAALHPGWIVGHVHNGSVTAKNGAFSIASERTAEIGAVPLERLTIVPQGYVGINAFTPETYLHVGGDAALASSYVSLLPNTGLAQFGPTTKSVLIDPETIQARVGTDTGGGVFSFDPSPLHLQKLGGELVIHGGTGIPEDEQVVVRTNGRVGLGETTPLAKLHINGRAIFGDNATDEPVEGAVRWTGDDLEVFDGTSWVSLTGGAGYWTAAGVDKITYNPLDAQVGIGVAVPGAALDVQNNTDSPTGSIGASVSNLARTTGTGPDDMRLGLQIRTDGTWSSIPSAKNIALFASALGQENRNANMAAVLDGNVVIGSLVNGADMVGTNGDNVLVLQNATAPTAQVGGAGARDRGVQIYSDRNAAGISIFHVMNGDGTSNVVKLFRSPAIPVANNELINDTYDALEMNVINNIRERVNAIETILRNLGLL
jgi:hypothetical protein